MLMLTLSVPSPPLSETAHFLIEKAIYDARGASGNNYVILHCCGAGLSHHSESSTFRTSAGRQPIPVFEDSILEAFTLNNTHRRASKHLLVLDSRRHH